MLRHISAVMLVTFVLGSAAAGQAAQGGQPPLPEGPRFIVTYVEVAPASEAKAIALMKSYRDATRRVDGNSKVDVLQRNARPGHFVITEHWRDDAAWKAHRQGGHATHFQDMLKGLRVGPYDERAHAGLAGLVTGSGASVAGEVVLVVTHVDVIPPGQVQLREMLKTLAEASRKESGNAQFEVLQGVRQNHFTVLEAWRDQRAYEAHVTAGHTKTFREELQPKAADGAPYDERLYRLVP